MNRRRIKYSLTLDVEDNLSDDEIREHICNCFESDFGYYGLMIIL